MKNVFLLSLIITFCSLLNAQIPNLTLIIDNTDAGSDIDTQISVTGKTPYEISPVISQRQSTIETLTQEILTECRKVANDPQATTKEQLEAASALMNCYYPTPSEEAINLYQRVLSNNTLEFWDAYVAASGLRMCAAILEAIRGYKIVLKIAKIQGATHWSMYKIAEGFQWCDCLKMARLLYVQLQHTPGVEGWLDEQITQRLNEFQ